MSSFDPFAPALSTMPASEPTVITDADRALAKRILRPELFDDRLYSNIVDYLSVNQPDIPLSSVRGYATSVGMFTLADKTLTASAANIDFANISSTYAHLRLAIYARGDQAANQVTLLLRFNGDVGLNYDYQYIAASAATTSAAESLGASGIQVATITGATGGVNLFAAADCEIPYYATTANNKSLVSRSAAKYGTVTGNLQIANFAGFWRSNAAINRITLLPAVGNLVAGTRVTLYALGIK